MGSMVKGISSAISEVVKDIGAVNGSKAKPADIIPAELSKAADALADTKGDIAPLMKAMETFGKEMQGVQKKLDQVDKTLEDAAKSIGKADFGLDPKKAEHKKAIADARKTLLAAVDGARGELDQKLKPLANLDKTVASFGKSGLA